MNWLKRNAKAGASETDLFGEPVPNADEGRPEAHVIADRLREMSEAAFHAGLETASGLIEAAALVTEMEGDRPPPRGQKRGG